jgi:hypothetical protein
MMRVPLPGHLLSEKESTMLSLIILSLIGARVRAEGKRLPPVGSPATLTMNEDNLRFYVRCKVVGLDEGDYYRLKFDGIGEGSLNNLMAILRKLGNGTYSPESELPNLVLDLG